MHRPVQGHAVIFSFGQAIEKLARLLAKQRRKTLAQGLVGARKLLACKLDGGEPLIQPCQPRLLFFALCLQTQGIAELLEGACQPVGLGAERDDRLAAPAQPVADDGGIVGVKLLVRLLLGLAFTLVFLQEGILLRALALGPDGALQILPRL